MDFKYIESPEEYYHTMVKKKKVKVMEEYLPEQQNATLYDISLHKKGPMEDKLYIRKPFYLINIRRGNSLIKIDKDYHFCRRGMKKFYDLEKKYIEKELCQKDHKLTGYHQRVLNNILGPIKQNIENGARINFYRTFKENGEHCQISYVQQLDRWLVASKNVTILVRDHKELAQYTKERYIWAKIIGEEWLNIVSTFKDNIQELKDLMQNHTFIGEYCGNQNYQHITRYDKISIIFYSIVENNSENTCLPVAKAKQIFQQFNLTMVKVEEMLGIKNYKEAVILLGGWLQKVGEADMLVEGEGSVVYIEAEQNGKSNTISLCKLKTIEYLVYRKLRELLKILAQKRDQREDYPLMSMINKFYQEYKLITECFNPPKPLIYYMSLAKFCFEYLYTKNVPFIEIRYKFVDFLEHMQALFKEKGEELSLKQIIPQESKQIRSTRIVIITQPLLVTDDQIARIKSSLNVGQLDSQFLARQPAAQVQKRVISVLYLIPKMPYNITDQKALEEHLTKSNLGNQDPLNVYFLFYGLEAEGENESIQRLSNEKFIQQNPESMNLSVQFCTAKPSQRELLVKKWTQKSRLYYDEIRQQYPNRCFNLPYNQDLQETLNSIFSDGQYFGNQKLQSQKELDKSDVHLTSSDDENSNDLSEKSSGSDRSINHQQFPHSSLKLVVIYPLLTPGCGKTAIIDALKNQIDFAQFISISADDVNHSLMQKTNANSSLQQKYSTIQAKQKDEFYLVLFQNIKDLMPTQDNQHKTAIIYLDRNCPPKTLLSTSDQIKAIQSELQNICSVRVKNLGILLPEIPKQIQISDTPISYEQALIILSRLLYRENHQTLQDDPVYKAKVLMKYITLYKNVKNKQRIVQKLNLHSIVHLNQFKDLLVYDSTQMKQLITTLDKCLSESSLSKELGQGDCFATLIKLFYQFTPDQECLQQDVLNQAIALDAQKIAKAAKDLLEQFK